MTNTPNLASIFLPISWDYIRDENGEIEYAKGSLRNSSFFVYPTHWFYGYSTYGDCDGIVDGIEQITEAFHTAILRLLDLTKLQQQRPFWRKMPPRKTLIHGKRYLLDNDGIPVIALWSGEYNAWYIDKRKIPYGLWEYFAEIPSCEVQS